MPKKKAEGNLIEQMYLQYIWLEDELRESREAMDAFAEVILHFREAIVKCDEEEGWSKAEHGVPLAELLKSWRLESFLL